MILKIVALVELALLCGIGGLYLWMTFCVWLR